MLSFVCAKPRCERRVLKTAINNRVLKATLPITRLIITISFILLLSLDGIHHIFQVQKYEKKRAQFNEK